MAKEGKLIVIEGTDCSGKQTQTDLLVKNLQMLGYKAISFSFPMYDSPTGKIIQNAYLGENTPSYFKEGIEKVDPKISSLYYAADRVYNIEKINQYIKEGYIVVVNRYVQSSMAYQGGKLKDIKLRHMMYEWLDNLEFVLLDLPRPDYVLFLYLPYEEVCRIKKVQKKNANENILRMAEIAYFELSNIYEYQKIECMKNNQLRSIEEIGEEIKEKIIEYLKMEERK